MELVKRINKPTSLNEIGLRRLAKLRMNREKMEIVDYSEWADPTEKGGVKLPENVVNLIQNPLFQNRVKYLVRNYGVKYIKKLAELAYSKGKPQCWFAKCYSKARWEEQTLPFLKKMLYKAERMQAKLAELRANSEYIPFFIKAENMLGAGVFEEILVKATGPTVKNPNYYFRGAIKSELGKLG